MFKRDRKFRLFPPRKGAAMLRRIEDRAADEYGVLYKDGRAKALERAEEVAREKVAEAAQKSEAEVNRDQARVEANFWDKLKRVARQIPFLEDLIAAYYAMRDPDTPLQVRAALVFGLLYFLWTFDIIPDFLGVMGFADDGTVITTILMQVSASIKDEHRARAREVLGVEGF
ncbi:MAG: YkvA family protein [Oceanicaulis sp.]